jgi:hypothetical protein
VQSACSNQGWWRLFVGWRIPIEVLGKGTCGRNGSGCVHPFSCRFSGLRIRWLHARRGARVSGRSAANSTRREAVRRTKHPRRTRLVRPIGTDLVCSQDRIAKKKAPSTRSATWARVEASPVLLVAVLRKVWNVRRNLGVIAFCRFGGGSLLSKAFNKAQMAGSSWELPST